MIQQIDLAKQVTILVNSCDAYEDTWIPFFTLLKKYWDTKGMRIVLNTETKDFSFEGLKIDCVHPPVGSDYGKRMRCALKSIKTKYVISLLDDFFIRQPVDNSRIESIVKWMEEDPNIVYFNCDRNTVYADWEVNKYPGFRRLPPGNDYILSMQAAVWNTKQLRKYWRANINPWEWEMFCNTATIRHPKDKFYTSLKAENMFMDYGLKDGGWGIYRGKWVEDDVVPLFQKEDIAVDFAVRGFYRPNEVCFNISLKTNRTGRYRQIKAFFGWKEIPRYFLFCQQCRTYRLLKKGHNDDYYKYLKEKAQINFLALREKAKVQEKNASS